jgi:hypothetical protein
VKAKRTILPLQYVVNKTRMKENVAKDKNSAGNNDYCILVYKTFVLLKKRSVNYLPVF